MNLPSFHMYNINHTRQKFGGGTCVNICMYQSTSDHMICCINDKTSYIKFYPVQLQPIFYFQFLIKFYLNKIYVL